MLVHAVLTARELGLPVTVLGRCTNVLVGDAGVPGLTVLARNEGTTLHGDVLRAEAGVELPGLVADLAGQGLAGLDLRRPTSPARSAAPSSATPAPTASP